jgi:hypothetical protein
MGSVVLFLYIIFSHKQKMLMIEKGMLNKTPLDIDALSIFSGLILSAVGLTLTLFFWFKEGLGYSLLSGLLPLSIGISLCIFFIIRRKNSNDKKL